MSELKQRIQGDIKTAMRDKDKDRLTTLRMITAAFKQKEVDERVELDDTQALAIMDKLCKQHRESIKQFEDGGRDDLVARENSELAIIQEYMPTPLSDAEIDELIQSAIRETGAETVKEMGKVMGVLKPRVQGRVDMGKVSGLIKSRLGQ